MQIVSNNANLKNMDKVVFPELSYKLVGAAFTIYNAIGWGFPEKVYQKALVEELKKLGISYKQEAFLSMKYKDANIARYFADFIIEDKILLELKVVSRLGYTHSKQVLGYLKSSGLKLGILVYFTKDGVKYRRILNSEV